jgi:hypothetical protein
MLGDCYFMSALASLAESPERVKRLFTTDKVNEAGCYAVKLWINGIEQEVVVDDYFPWINHMGKQGWAFAKTAKKGVSANNIWVLILEKAWAKVFGNYSVIEGG